MRQGVVFTLLFGGVLTAWAAEPPVAVSPGSSDRVSVVEARCPSFSWGSVRGAASYELAVYRIGEAGETEHVVHQTVHGSASSWTPALGQCLTAGGRYAWSIRALRKGNENAFWSTPSLFEVAARPSATELEEALAIVRRYLAGEQGVGGGLRPDVAATAETGLEQRSGSETLAEPSVAPVVEPTQLTVDGGIVAGSFTGDGSTLTALDPTNLSPGTAAISISGNAATAASATDSNTLDGIDSTAFLQAIQVDTEVELEALLGDVTNVLTDNEPAATTTALAADGANCAADEAAAGVDASGNAQDCHDQADLTAIGNNTRVGGGALSSNTTGSGNTASGFGALEKNLSGNANTASGHAALYANTTGSFNTASGFNALLNNTGDSNTASGFRALTYNTIGNDNTANGALALSGAGMTGSNNTASGSNALRNNSMGDNNTAIGTEALENNSTGSYNTASGFRALEQNIDGNGNTATGSYALSYNSTGYHNTAAGYRALYFNTGNRNTASGAHALRYNTTGSNNTASGSNALRYNSMGDNNTAIGTEALENNSTGSYNTASGFRALEQNIDGNGNTATGSYALSYNSTGYHNTAAGYRALYFNTGNRNTASGAHALRYNTTGSNNTASGSNALRYNSMGDNNTANGFNALSDNTTGSNNTASGLLALHYNIDGDRNTANGAYALRFNATGYGNTASGYRALNNNSNGDGNTAIGARALINTTGSGNTAIGTGAGSYATTGSNNIFVGTGGNAGDDGTIRIGNSFFNGSAFIAGIRGKTTGVNDAVAVLIDSAGQLGTTSSSRRYKDDIEDMGSLSERLLALRPVTFRYKKEFNDSNKPIQFGLIAEEVAEVFPELVVYDEEGRPETVKYHLLSTLLLNELQKERQTNDEQARMIKAQALAVERQEQKLAELAALKERLTDLEDVKARLVQLEALETRPPRVALREQEATRFWSTPRGSPRD